jgi:hypothetical protein
MGPGRLQVPEHVADLLDRLPAPFPQQEGADGLAVEADDRHRQRLVARADAEDGINELALVVVRADAEVAQLGAALGRQDIDDAVERVTT